MTATNIKWDTDGDENLLKELPNTIPIPDNVAEDEIDDYLSDVTGFCHFGYDLVSKTLAHI